MGIGLALGGMTVFVGLITLMGRADGNSWRKLVPGALLLSLVLGGAVFMVWASNQS